MTPTAAPKLAMHAITRAFPGVKALNEVSLEARAGEVVGLVGVNGAGKSTLMNVLGGILQPDAGRIEIDGVATALHSPKDASHHGIAFIHQELLFFASQTVAENIFISRLFPHPVIPFLVSKKAAAREAALLLGLLGSDINPIARMEDLSVGERQMVEIARALAAGSQIVIFDEPTSSLSMKEKDRLFAVIHRLKAEGKAIIYISHFLDEILDLCDRFVVLRNGSVHGSGNVVDVTKADIIRMIIGRDLNVERGKERAVGEQIVLKADGIRRGNLLKGIDFDLHEGEILGIWGLMGSGRTELVRALMGLDRRDGGLTRIRAGAELREIGPDRLLDRSGYVTESRHADGLFLSQPLWKNVSATALGTYMSRIGFLDRRREGETAGHYIDLLKIAAPGHDAAVRTLSGGNQQKVVFAKWLNRKAQILVLDEPTRGVDVGAKLEIGRLIKDLADKGTAILLITSELEEMIGLADRVLVLRDGRIADEMRGPAITSGRLMQSALGGTAA